MLAIRTLFCRSLFIVFPLAVCLEPYELVASESNATDGIDTADQRISTPRWNPNGLPQKWDFEILLNGHRRHVELEQHSLRSPDFRVRVGSSERSEDFIKTPISTYRGRVLGEPTSIVAATLSPRGLFGMILIDEEEPWYIQPSEHQSTHSLQGWHRVARKFSGDMGPDHFGKDECATCQSGGANVDPSGFPSGTHTSPALDSIQRPLAQGGNCTLRAQIAFDADYELFLLNGSSVSATVADIESVLNTVDLIYARDVLITHEITEIIVRTAEPDPYDGSDAGQVLNQFRDTWNSTHGNIVRDIAHLVTARPLDAGILGLAYVGVTCNQPWSYGLSQFNVAFDTKVSIVGHELGHNWSAPHCLDPSCVLMCGGCHEFGARTAQMILNYRDANAGCLDVPTNFLPPTPPRALDDSIRDVVAPVILDVLANDHDANCDTPYIESFDLQSMDGGRIERMIGSGPGGRDQLRYSPPLGFDGRDEFTYTLADGTGLQDIGFVNIEASRFLLTHYRLDEITGFDALDSTGNGNDGTYMNGPLLAQNGAAPGTNTSVTFDGLNDRVRVFNNASLASLKNDFTVAAWVRPALFGGTRRIIANAGSWAFGLNANDLRFSTLGIQDFDKVANLPLNTWSHIAAVFDAGSDVTFYLNGQNLGVVGGSAPASPAGSKWFLGTLDNNGEFFQGGIDDLQVYRGFLNAAEIRYLYEHPGLSLCLTQWTNYGDGHPGTLGVPELIGLGQPDPGSPFGIRMENASGIPSQAILFIGLTSAQYPLLGGTLWLDPIAIFQLPLPAAGIDLDFTVPGDLACVTVLLQGMHPDSGASQGFAWTQGLGVTIGL